MWLIDTRSYKLKYFQDAAQVAQQYAILSHRWEDDEVSHSDMTSRWDRLRLKRMKGWYKIQKCCEQAVRDNLSYAWVDTCCIDKSSSAELQEAINSMFSWYAKAKVCYVFLSDVKLTGVAFGNCLENATVLEAFKKSRWFTRGWTLQELLAPKELTFYDLEWQSMGSRVEHKEVISDITGIQMWCLDGFDPEWTRNTQICIAQVMAWASGRLTTRLEDKAYSLLGIFAISLPMLYGEGNSAFLRLQEELLRTRDDQSIFAWKPPNGHGPMAIALTDTPDDFIRPPKVYSWLRPGDTERRKPHVVSNDGIVLDLLLRPVRPGVYHASCNTLLVNTDLQHQLDTKRYNDTAEDGTVIVMAVAFPIQEIDLDGHFIRLTLDKEGGLIFCPSTRLKTSQLRRITLSSFFKAKEYEMALEEDASSFAVSETVSELWSFSRVREDGIEIPQTWPWQPLERRIIESQKAPAIVGLLTWNGWPHKIHWGLDNLPVSAVAFGYDFDFNPSCIIALGRMSYDASMAARLQRVIEDDIGGKSEVKISEIQKLTIDGGACELFHVTDNLRDALSHHDEHRDPPMLMLVKSTASTRWSCKGFHATVHLDNSQYDRYYKGKLHIKMSRESKKVPWEIELSIERSDITVIARSLMPRLQRFVSPYGGRPLGNTLGPESIEDPTESSSAST